MNVVRAFGMKVLNCFCLTQHNHIKFVWFKNKVCLDGSYLETKRFL